MSAVNNRPDSATENPSERTPAWQYEILTVTFNQDFTSLALGTLNTFSLFTINQENKLDEIHDCEIQPIPNIPNLPYDEVCIIERLFSSSLIALVSRQAPRKLKVCHFRRGTEICAYSFTHDIRAVKLNRSRLVIVLEESIYIHSMRDMKLLHHIREAANNLEGLCALSPSESNPYLAYPASTINGGIQIFDTINLKPGTLISAHESPLAAMAFDSTGTRIATASNKGTIIRVHNVLDGSRLFEFRRGLLRAATIYSLAFSPDFMFLAVSSSSGTVHIFRLVDIKEKASEEPTTWMGSFGRMLTGAASYLPKQTSEVLTQDRAFATVHLPASTKKTIVGMNTFNKTLKLFVAGYDGIVHIYEVNTTEGGECKQIREQPLFSIPQTPANPPANEVSVREARNPTALNSPASAYPPNVLRTRDNPSPLPSPLINNKHYVDDSFKTATEHASFPKLPSPPSESVDD